MPNEHDQGMEGLQAALAARATVKGWAEGLEVLELVRAAQRAGWLDQLRAETTAAQLAAATRVPVDQAENVLLVLAAAGVVEGTNPFQLTPAFDALVAGASGVDLSTTLDAVELARERAAQAVRPEPDAPNGAQGLRLARDWGVRATPGSRQLYQILYQSLPGYRDRLDRGGPLLDVGSGIGGVLLTTLTLFDKLRAVGVEIVPEVAAELGKRAEEAEVAGRAEIRAVDARTLTDVEKFEVSFWAHEFFPVETRADTLAVILRALRPGGLLLVQELFPPREEPTTRTALDRLFFEQQRTAFGRSAEELADEGRAAGFQEADIIATPLGRLVMLRKP
ncbi:SAM-dependent methyltransferase [Lentzea sp. E54]|uniref:SAM-dependent methyltransferase n=1 Tax=Lentzea xerophila TaxID=3435883 RepID=UPI003DA32503